MERKKRAIMWLIAFLILLIVLMTIFYENFLFKEIAPDNFESPKSTEIIVS